MSDLVIVESPAKAKTIQKYLGEGFEVVASNGHVRDLPKSKIGVDIEKDFEPKYENIKGKENLIADLMHKAEVSHKVYLATDPDREGEAISWHLAHILGLDLNDKNRITFNEITKSGVKSGMENPRCIDINLVNAQQSRRILDRIVGYKLSPFLWRKVKRGLSAGRVQSVVVRLIVDREKEIKKFKPEEYWSIDAKMTAKGSRKQFDAKLVSHKGKKINIKNEEQAKSVLAEIKDSEFVIEKVKKGIRKKSPAPPFTTSTLQQEASRKLGFQAKKTMKAAQELYEGVEIDGMGAVGLITYMRTDSLRVSEEAMAAAEEYILSKYSKEYLPSSRRYYKTKSAAQDAHEAIRPTMPMLTPAQAKKNLTGDQYKLYKLIWERFIASQMANALLNTVSADINADDYTFRASGFTVEFDGFTVLYEEGKDESEESKVALPPMNEGDPVKVKSLDPNQHFTQPPARFTEASLIKTLEENGIGRPSTYAPTITTVIQRSYVERDGKTLKPTVLGDVTTELMEEQFSNIVDVDFTANMEKSLDHVEEGSENWVDSLHAFYNEFSTTLEQAEKNMEGKRVKIPAEETNEVCEVCGKPMVIKIGRFGKFLACSGFPECTFTKKIVLPVPGNCPICGKKIVAQKSKKGRSFYGCSGYPECNFMTWEKPLEDVCPKCGSTLFKKAGKSGKIHCLKEGCGYERGTE